MSVPAGGNGALRVVVADDYPPVRLGVRALLEQHGFSVCGEASDARGAVDEALAKRPEVCVLDVKMPGGGVAAAREITEQLPETSVVMFTVSRDESDLVASLRAGADGYVLKDSPQELLPTVLRGVVQGESAVPKELLRRLVDTSLRHRRQRELLGDDVQALTAREWEILELMRDGLSTAEIAERLVVQPVTVRTHVASILRKLGARDRRDALRRLQDR